MTTPTREQVVQWTNQCGLAKGDYLRANPRARELLEYTVLARADIEAQLKAAQEEIERLSDGIQSQANTIAHINGLLASAEKRTADAMMAKGANQSTGTVCIDPDSDLGQLLTKSYLKDQTPEDALVLAEKRLKFILRKQLISIQDVDDTYFLYNHASGRRYPEADTEMAAIDAAMREGEKE